MQFLGLTTEPTFVVSRSPALDHKLVPQYEKVFLQNKQNWNSVETACVLKEKVAVYD